MRDSMRQLLDICYDVKVMLCVSSFSVSYYEDGSFCDFEVTSFRNLQSLLKIVHGLEICLLGRDNRLVIRIFENYDE